MTWRTVIIGGDAAGMSAATRVRAGRPTAEVVVLERSRFTSYSACGIPFLVGGLIQGGVEALVARDPAEHGRRGLDVRIRHAATVLDTGAGEVEVLDEHAGETYRLAYDEVLVATGGEPIRPDLPGIDLPMVHGVQDLTDAEALLSLAEDGCRRIVIVGGGYIGLEMAEAYIERGCTATIVDRNRQPFSVIDEDFGARVADVLRDRGVDVRTETVVSGFEPGAVITSDGPIPADLVVLGLGVGPRNELAEAAGIELGANGAIRVDERQQTSSAHVWSAGDCAEATHLVTGAPVHIALGTYANRHGRVAGINMAGGDARSRRVLGTAITKLCTLEIALTGARLDAARDAGFDAFTATIDTTTASGYLPQATAMTVRLVVERGTGRLLGGQIIGGPGAAKRIDTIATAITAEMDVQDVMDLDLSYAPPFSSVWDPVAVAAREALKDV